MGQRRDAQPGREQPSVVVGDAAEEDDVGRLFVHQGIGGRRVHAVFLR
jgi:hypothetical protein